MRRITTLAILSILSLTFAEAAIAEDGVKLYLGKSSSALHMPIGEQIVIGHELEHQYCHYIGRKAGPRNEPEADRFLGAAMRNAGYTLNQALAAVPILVEISSGSSGSREGDVGWVDTARTQEILP